MNFEKLLENKYGGWINGAFYKKQCKISSISERTYLNVLFNPIDQRYYETIEKILNWVVCDDLKHLYTKYNGMMLFCQSFRIFGVNINGGDYKTLDLLIENGRIESKFKKKFDDYVTFGYYAEYSFFYKRNGEDLMIYIYSRNSGKFIKTFDNLNQLFDYYIPALMKEYDGDGIVLDKDNSFSNTLLKEIQTPSP